MPRPPHTSRATREIPGAVFSPIANKMRAAPGDVCPLHVGDTWMEPFSGGRMQDLRVDEHPGMHRYCEPRGLPELVDALVEKLRARNGLDCERENVLVTGGATAGLGALVASVADPGDEILILAPFWPLIRGIVQSFRATPVEVPFFGVVDSAAAAVEAVREQVSERTVALYVSTPSNPTGRIIPGAWLEALAEWAREMGVWLISDEVYEDYVYRGEHVSTARFAPERTLSAFSFSKAYGMAGNRTAYVTGPAELMAEAQKIGTHTAYHAPTAGQLSALRALSHGEAWVSEARALYRRVGDETAARLGVPPPEGSHFHFLDVRSKLDARGIWGFLADCVDDGVALAPGPSFGHAYEGWARVCYTAAPPDEVLAAVDRLALRLR